MGPESIPLSSLRGRCVVLTTVLGAAMVFLDGTVTNVALPALSKDLNADFSMLQWVIDAYLLVLGAFLLLGGSLGDVYGRKRVFIIGMVGFAVSSVLCGLSPQVEVLIAARALQGAAGALLVPGSLAVLSSTFDESERAEAIGVWSAGAALTTAAGPMLGGLLIDFASWRWVFLLNLPLAVIASIVGGRAIPESKNPEAHRPDLGGAVLAAVTLSTLIFALIEGPVRGFSDPWVLAGFGTALVSGPTFLGFEARQRQPMLPLSLFSSSTFVAANIITLAIYFGLSGAAFFLVLELQTALGYSAFEAGLTLMPMTVAMVLLSKSMGRLSARIGPRPLITTGAGLCALGLYAMSKVGPGSPLIVGILLPLAVFGLGLAVLVAPLTSTVFASVEAKHTGIASGVNNAVSRIASLFAIALLPLLAGVAGDHQLPPDLFTAGYQRAMLWSSGACVLGAIAALGFLRPRTERDAP